MSGLRERKKQVTREALSWAALQLTVQRGWDGVLVEDIAAAAGVSPRTFNNYFSSKAEAIASRHRERFAELADELRRRPPAEPLWDALRAATLAVLHGGGHPPPEGWTAGVRIMTTHPALSAEFAKAESDGEQLVALAVADRTGARDPIYPQLVAAAVRSALLIAMRQWMQDDRPGPIGPMALAALDRFAAGLAAEPAP